MTEEHKTTVTTIAAVAVAAAVAIGAYVAWTMDQRKVTERREGIELGKAPWLDIWMDERADRLKRNEQVIQDNRHMIIEHMKDHSSK